MKDILIVVSDYYKEVSDMLLAGASEKLAEYDYSYDIIYVPGALEIAPAIAIANSRASDMRQQEGSLYKGYIALGCVIRGETYHFDIVANESSRALMDLCINQQLAIGNGILTVENGNQAMERADIAKGNKGAWAAHACVKLIELKFANDRRK